MAGEEILKRMQTWLNSAAMPSLIGSYRLFHKRGTMTAYRLITDPVLAPDEFQQHMEHLKLAVNEAVETGVEMRSIPGDNRLARLESTLQSLFPSTSIDQGIARDFAHGNALGQQLRDYFKAIGVVQTSHTHGGYGGIS